MALAALAHGLRGLAVIRDLPRGQFGAFLRMHYLNDKSSFPPRFSMGCGAVFMIQRIKPMESTLLSRGAISETDPQLLEEMIALVSALRLDVISIEQMQKRLMQRDFSQRFVCFTFDGAYRSIRTAVFPLFKKHNLPFTVYTATDFLDRPLLPWWLSLEVLMNECDTVSLEIGSVREGARCRRHSEKKVAYARFFQLLAQHDPQTRVAVIGAALKKHGLDGMDAARHEMLSSDELKELARSGLVTIGSQGGGSLPLRELGYDRARESIEQSIQTLEKATGQRPRTLSYPGGISANVTPRDVEIAKSLDLESAVTAVEGAIWPEHVRELLSLPRIALDNDPATLVRALMLGGEGLSSGWRIRTAGAA